MSDAADEIALQSGARDERACAQLGRIRLRQRGEQQRARDLGPVPSEQALRLAEHVRLLR